MNKKQALLDILGIILVVGALLLLTRIISIKNSTPPPYIPPVILTNTDTLYQEIEILKLKRDTIKLYYEKKINNYRTLPTTERVQLFADRINR